MKADTMKIWFVSVGRMSIGVDLANWGAGFMFSFRKGSRGFSAHIGPFYMVL